MYFQFFLVGLSELLGFVVQGYLPEPGRNVTCQTLTVSSSLLPNEIIVDDGCMYPNSGLQNGTATITERKFCPERGEMGIAPILNSLTVLVY
jgi:hypothetical protein